MCHQFKAVKVVITTGPAVSKDHDGSEFVYEPCKVGTVLAYDAKGHLYSYTGPGGEHSWDEHMEAYYRRTTKRAMVLFRDYWQHVMLPHEATETNPRKLSPVNAAILNAPKRVFWQAQ